MNKLKGLMKEKEITQEKLAKMIDITPQSLNSKLNNRRLFNLDEVKKICDILDIEDPKAYFFN